MNTILQSLVKYIFWFSWSIIVGGLLISGPLNKYFEAHDLPAINANELRDLSVQHFSQEGADVRSLQALRQFKQLRRLQSLNESDFSNLQKSFKQKHLRSSVLKEE